MRALNQVNIYLNTPHWGKLDHLMVLPLHSLIVWRKDICMELTPLTGPTLTLPISQALLLSGQPLCRATLRTQ